MLIMPTPVCQKTLTPHPPRGDVAIILSGGGARAAYQVGVLRGLSRHFPRARPLILAGESAGAINAAHPPAHPGTPPEAGEGLPPPWGPLTAAASLPVGGPSPPRHALGWGKRVMLG